MHARRGGRRRRASELGRTPPPRFTATSATGGGATRGWDTLDAFVDEVSNARVYDGVDYRFSTEVGAELGRKVGTEVARRFLGK